MVPRYSLPEMAAVWSEERKLAAWTEVEALVVAAWAEAGVAPGQTVAFYDGDRVLGSGVIAATEPSRTVSAADRISAGSGP